ncbi:MAG: hypothetical protein RIF41_02145, partial [Polyangiaceae bacterium]
PDSRTRSGARRDGVEHGARDGRAVAEWFEFTPAPAEAYVAPGRVSSRGGAATVGQIGRRGRR